MKENQFISSKENFLFSTQVPVRINDINYGNHLCHTKLISIIHNARALFLKHHNLSELDCYGVGLVMLKLNVEYISQAFFADLLEIKIYLRKLEGARLELDYIVENRTTEKLTATVNTLMGFYDKQKNKLAKVPAELEKLFKSIQ
jgi:acyl-CoA thioester hydrolase